jgi:DNA polymerase-3 subunit delta'
MCLITQRLNLGQCVFRKTKEGQPQKDKRALTMGRHPYFIVSFNFLLPTFEVMLLKQIVGQKNAKNGFLKMWESNHLPHAIMIVGAEGTGGLPFALAIAQYVFCKDKKNEDACGVCIDCNKISRLEHADFHLTFPAISPKPGTKSMSRYFIQDFREFVTQTPYASVYDWLQYINAENKQGNISAEECREIIDKLNLKSYEGGKKVQIIWMAEYLGKEGNILLKLIEEPPAETLLLLIAENLEEVLTTIQSRTQLLRLSPIHAADIAQGLTERSLADTKKAAQIAHLANGSFAEALRLSKHNDNDLFPEVRSWFNALFTNNGIELVKFADNLSKDGREQQKNLLQYTIQLLEQAIKLRYLPQLQPPLPEEEAAFVRKLSKHSVSFDALQKMVETISKTIYHIERNAHSKTQILSLSIQLVYCIQGRKVNDFM